MDIILFIIVWVVFAVFIPAWKKRQEGDYADNETTPNPDFEGGKTVEEMMRDVEEVRRRLQHKSIPESVAEQRPQVAERIVPDSLQRTESAMVGKNRFVKTVMPEKKPAPKIKLHREALKRGIVWAEILQKPKSLRRH